MTVQFIQLNEGKDAFNKCLAAIEYVANMSNGSWKNKYINEAKQIGHLPITRVFISNYKLFNETNITWEYIAVYGQQASYKYCNSDGIDICILEDCNRKSRVHNAVGLPDAIVEKLEGLDNVSLNEALDLYVKGHIIDSEGIDLRISEYIQ